MQHENIFVTPANDTYDLSASQALPDEIYRRSMYQRIFEKYCFRAPKSTIFEEKVLTNKKFVAFDETRKPVFNARK